MQATTPVPDPAQTKPLADEADIGSGEKPPSQLETEDIIRQIPKLPPSDQDPAGHAARSAAGQSNGEPGKHGASSNSDEPGDPAPPKAQ